MTRLVRRSALPALMVALVARAASAQVPALGDFVLFADQNLKARGLTVDSGDIGANQTLTATKRLDAGDSTVVANTVDLDKASTCQALLANGGSATPHCGPRTSFAPPVVANLASACGFPGSFPTTCSGDGVVVAHDATIERGAGTYGNVDVAGGGAGPGTLILTGGTYTFCSLTVHRNGRILARAPSVIQVIGKIKFDNGSNVGPETGSVSPCDVQIFSNGDKVRVSRRAHLQAFLCAPKAKLELTAGAKLTGAFYAREVKTDRVTLEHACGTPTTTSTTTPTTSTSTTGPVTSTSTTTSTTMTTSICGNGIVDAGEQCDPPGSAGGAFCPPESGCTASCQCTITSTTSSSTVPSTSSTSTLEETTSTTSSSTTTSTTSTTAVCGNSIVESGEQCDPPGSAGGAFCPPGSGCSETCQCTLSTSTTSSSEVPSTSSTSSTQIPTTSSTSSPSTSTTSSSAVPSTAPTSSSTSTSVPTTSSSSSSSTTTSLTPTTTSSSTTSSSTTTSAPPTTTTIGGGPSGFDFISVPATGACGNTFKDLAKTIPLKNLLCGSLSLGGGLSQVPDNATPAGATNRFSLSCAGNACTVGPTSAGTVPAGVDCTDTGCIFGTPLPISNAGLSVCVTNTFSAPVSGTLDIGTGSSTLDFELNSGTVLTGNPTQPCPICAVSVGGAACVGSAASPCTGVCDGSPNQGATCTTKNANGLTSDCPSPNATAAAQKCFRGTNNGATCATGADCPGGLCAQFIGNIPISLNPLTTGTAPLTSATGIFCPGQTSSTHGAFKSDICQTGANSGKPCDRNASGQDPAHCGAGITCRAGTLTNYCSAGTNAGLGCAIATDCGTGGVCSRAGTLAQVVQETGVPTGALAIGVPKQIKLGSAFCVAATSNPTVNSNANLPAAGATSVVGNVTLLP